MDIKFSPNLSTMFTDSPFLERFSRAKQCGFSSVEFQFPYDFSPADLKAILDENKQNVVLFNLPVGNQKSGDRGLACLPDRVNEFNESVEKAMEYAQTLDCHLLNCLVGKRDEQYSLEEQLSTLEMNLTRAATKFTKHNITLLVEHLNPFDAPGFLFQSPGSVFQFLQKSSLENVKVQYDIYHAQRSEGELTGTIEKHLPHIGHIQLADNPGRHQPGTGEINFRFLLNRICDFGYKGFIGLEYFPVGKSEESFGWINEYLNL